MIKSDNEFIGSVSAAPYRVKESNIFIGLNKDLFGCFRIKENEAMAMKHV